MLKLPAVQLILILRKIGNNAKGSAKGLGSDSSAIAAQENDCTEGSDLRRPFSETEGKNREGRALLPIRLKLNLL